MTTIQKINKKVQDLPEIIQEKVLEYIEDLNKEKEEHDKWLDFSINAVMDKIDNDEIQYDEKDLKEKWT